MRKTNKEDSQTTGTNKFRDEIINSLTACIEANAQITGELIETALEKLGDVERSIDAIAGEIKRRVDSE